MNLKIRLQLSSMMFFEYFIWGAWYVTMGTYLGTTLKFDGLQIGIAYGAMAISSMISPFLVGMIADRFFATEKILGVLHLLGAVLLYLCTLFSEFSTFYLVLLAYTLCYMPTLALTNSISFNQMKDPEKEFPAIRVLGTIGWIVAGIAIGVFGLETEATLKGTYYMAAIMSAIMGVYCFSLPHTPPKKKEGKVTISEVLGLDALGMLKDKSFAVLFIASLLISIPLSFYYNFTNLFLNEVGMENAASKMTLGQMSEIGFMLVMPFCFKKLGIKKMMIVGMAAWALRYIFFGYGDNDAFIWMLYGGILLHGICYDFFFVTGQIYVDNKAPDNLKSSAQGMITFATYGVGMFIGSLVSGKVVEVYSQSDIHLWKEIWIVPAVASGVVLLLFTLFFKDDKKKNEAVN